MYCMQCGRPASKYKIVVDGEEREAVLCPACYAALTAGEKPKVRRCPSCGMTFEEYLRTGLVGCARCYRTFRRELMPAILKLQGSCTHTGKTPGEDAGENYELLLERVRLRGRLEQALKRGDDEEAERLGEQVKALTAAIRGVRI